MGQSDMNHLRFLDTVRNNDVDTIREKEATYQGSWKKAGGGSAWFMARRNMDRLLEMMKPPTDDIQFSLVDLDDAIKQAGETPTGDCTLDFSVVQYLRDNYVSEDIFRKIEADPEGQDGTVLACVRDLRCYLTLIEAEMMAQGIVEGKPWASDETQGDLKITVEHLQPKLYTGDDHVVFEGWFYGCQSEEDGHVYVVQVRALHTNGEVTVDWGSSHQIISPTRLQGLVIGRRVVENETTQPSKPDSDESVHASLVPWGVSMQWRHRKGFPPIVVGVTTVDDKARLFDNWWTQRAPGLWTLEASVHSSVPLPLIIQHLYLRASEFYVLDIKLCPADARDWFPRLSREANGHEHNLLPLWQRDLYTWSTEGDKYVLAQMYDAWAKET